MNGISDKASLFIAESGHLFSARQSGLGHIVRKFHSRLALKDGQLVNTIQSCIRCTGH